MGIYAISTEGEEPLAAATLETVLQAVGGTAGRAKLIAWGISFDGISATAEPVVVRLARQSTQGTSTACTVAALDAADPTGYTTGRRAFTVEPTTTETIEIYDIHPQGGMMIREYPPGREPILAAFTTSRWGLRCTAPAVVNVAAWMHIEE